MGGPVRDGEGHVRGQVIGGEFAVTKYRAKHYLRAYGGWGLNVQVWRTLRAYGEAGTLLLVTVKEPDTGFEYACNIRELIEYEDAGEMQTITYRDEQVVLKESWFQELPPAQGRLF